MHIASRRAAEVWFDKRFSAFPGREDQKSPEVESGASRQGRIKASAELELWKAAQKTSLGLILSEAFYCAKILRVFTSTDKIYHFF